MRRLRAGMTLLEMMIVLAIVGIVLGIGAGMFAASRKDLGLRTAQSGALSMLRYARAQAIIRHAPTRVRADPQSHRFEVLADRAFGLWHGEDLKTTGAYGINGSVRGADLEHGKIGYAFHFKGAGNVTVEGFPLPAGADALWVEAWVYPDEFAGRPAIFEKAGEISLRIEGSGQFNAQIGPARVRVDAPRLALQQWSHVRLAAEDGAAVLYLNGQEIGAAPLPKPPAPGTAPFVIGDGFRGLIDEVAVRARVVEDFAPIDDTITWAFANAAPDPAKKGVFVIYLTDQGRLDPAAHTGPVTLTLTSPNAKQVVRVGWMGTTEP